MNNSLTTQANVKYFVTAAQKELGVSLNCIVLTDAYIRQPCYSSCASAQLFLILDNECEHTVNKLKFLRGEFPEFILNFVSLDELRQYPKHGVWIFHHSPILFQRDNFNLIEHIEQPDYIASISQAIIAVGHIARMYLLRDFNDKSLTWAVRQVGWALRYAELGIISIWNLIENGEYSNKSPSDEVTELVNWVCYANQTWPQLEKTLLADSNSYAQVAFKINHLTQWYGELAAKHFSLKKYIESEKIDDENMHFPDVINRFKERLQQDCAEYLQAVYLSGSTARGDVHKVSDVDTVVVFKRINNQLLTNLKNLLVDFPNFSIYSLSIHDVSIYPEFRYYTLNYGTKKLFGDIEFLPNHNSEYLRKAIINNIYTIKQISRHYRIQPYYGNRSVHLLILMFKLIDHGVLRLQQSIEKGEFPEKKEHVLEYFKNDEILHRAMAEVLIISEKRDVLCKQLLEGNEQALVEHFVDLEYQSKYCMKKFIAK
jgi:predicted nucleotidyltransferase